MEAARLIKSKASHSMVEVKDLQSGDITAVALGRDKRKPRRSGAGGWWIRVGLQVHGSKVPSFDRGTNNIFLSRWEIA